MRRVLHGPCRVVGCTRRPQYVESGYCATHHKTRHCMGSRPRWLFILNSVFHGPCRETPCADKASGVHGYCAQHRRWLRRHSALVGPKCRIPSCVRMYAGGRGGGYGLCGAHYRRLNRLYADSERRRWAAAMTDAELEALLESKEAA